MCRFRVCNVFNVATLRVVLMAIIALGTLTTASQSEDIYSKTDILVINPDKTTPWSRGMKHQRYNDPPRGYSEIFGIPWALYSPSSRGTNEPTNPSPSQADTFTHPQMDNGMVNQNSEGFARRSLNAMSPAEQEYQAVRRALARDRVQPSRRSMIPSRRVMQEISRNQDGKTIQDLLPLMYTLGSLIDKLDSPIDGLRQKTEDGNGNGRTKRRVMGLLRSLINRLDRVAEKRMNQVSDQPRQEKIELKEDAAVGDSPDLITISEKKETINESERENIAENRIPTTENESKNKSTDGVNLPENRMTAEVSENEVQRVSLPQEVNDEQNKTDVAENGEESISNVANVQKADFTEMGESSSFRTGIDQSEIPTLHALNENPIPKSSSESSGNWIDLVPEHRAFRTVTAAVKKPIDEDTGTPNEATNQ